MDDVQNAEPNDVIETPAEEPAVAAAPPLRGLAGRMWSPTPRAGMLLAGSVALSVAAFLLPQPAAPGVVRTWVLPAAGLLAVAAVAFAYHERKRYREHAKKLGELLGEICEGRAAIEELASMPDAGPLAPLVEPLAAVLNRMKRQRIELSQLDGEMRQRIASRTDALERTLGALKQQASRDPLTGLFNRRALDEHLPRLVAECRDEGSDLAVLMIDMDYFKLVNDNLGHATGDTLLADVAKIIRSSVRDADLPFRYGGDEFAILMPRTDTKSTQSVADRISSLGAQLGRTLRVIPQPKLSVGIAHLHGNPHASPEQLIEAADRALYSKKHARKSA